MHEILKSKTSRWISKISLFNYILVIITNIVTSASIYFILKLNNSIYWHAILLFSWVICALLNFSLTVKVFAYKNKQFISSKIVIYALVATTVYISSALGSSFVSGIYTINPANLKFATSMASALTASAIIGMALSLLSLPIFGIFITTQLMLPHKNSTRIYVGSACLAIIGPSLLWTGDKPLDLLGANYAKIFIARVAFDFDTVPSDLCVSLLNQKKILGPHGSRTMAIVPLASSHEKGYILISTQESPQEKHINSYTDLDVEKYTPKVYEKSANCLAPEIKP